MTMHMKPYPLSAWYVAVLLHYNIVTSNGESHASHVTFLLVNTLCCEVYSLVERVVSMSTLKQMKLTFIWSLPLVDMLRADRIGDLGVEEMTSIF